MDEEDNKKNIGYSLLFAVAYVHALLPFSVLYVFSDILYFVAYHIVRYRRKIVRKNLKNSFPIKSEKELIKIEKEFYHHLCDYFFETIKTLNLSEKEVMKRMKFENPEIINRLTSDGKPCIMSLGHYANWEWVPSICLHINEDIKAGLMYKKLHSYAFDKLFIKVRSRFKSIPLEMKTVYKRMINARENGITMFVGFLTDQRPPRSMNQFSTLFLNQETNMQIGMERIARRIGSSIVYLDISKVKRGFYKGKFHVITPDASIEPEFAIMERYIRRLEETIVRDPAYYLWSHDRWKFKVVNK